MRQARKIHDAGGDYPLAMYCSGLAVECILRAFRWDRDRSFEGRHDLEDLLKASALFRINEERSRKKGISQQDIQESALAPRAAFEVFVLWHNNLRYASESSLRAFLNRLGRLQGIKGDALKKNSADLLGAAQTVIDRGVALWAFRKK